MTDKEELAQFLNTMHFDGMGCGTHGVNACSNCHGPSPMTAHEVAEAILMTYAVLAREDVEYEYGIRYKEDAGLESRIRITNFPHITGLHKWADDIFDYFRRIKSGPWEEVK